MRTAGVVAGVAVLGLIAGSGDAVAAPGDLDPSFSHDGRVMLQPNSGAHGAIDAEIDGESRVWVAGYTATPGGPQDVLVARIRADGFPDPAFGGGDAIASFDLAAFQERASGIALAPDGGAYLATSSASGLGEMTVLKVAGDGSRDPGFSDDGVASTTIDGSGARAIDIALAPDGDVILAGSAGEGADQDVALARFAPDGSLDPGFGAGGTVRADLGGFDTAYVVEVDQSGRILVGGAVGQTPAIARFLANGQLDSGFSGDGIATLDVSGYGQGGGFTEVAIGDDGRIVAGASWPSIGLYQEYSTLVLGVFTESGEVAPAIRDEGPAIGGIAIGADESTTLAYTYDSCSFRGGSCPPEDFILDRYLATGQRDPQFGSGAELAVQTDFGRAPNHVAALATAPGRLVVAGTTSFEVGSAVTVARYLDEPGPRDADADGLAPGRDLCERSFAPEDPLGCEREERSVTLKHRKIDRKSRSVRFAGEVTTRYSDCFDSEEVFLYRVMNRRRKQVGSDDANGNGDFRIFTRARPGRYFAKVPNDPEPLQLCERAKSPFVTLRQGAVRGPGD